ncbi:MAG TPA: hypothetical protein VLA33_04680 [Gemmatimonadota bacterium]|nr:hypothetical protein [Gemmatimonadota bacterium]
MVERIGRSWRGALLDIVLIVGSILIAFALDAWWDGRLRADEEREALSALAEELRGSRVELDSVIAFNEQRRDAATYFVRLAGRDLRSLPLDSLIVAFQGSAGGMTFDPSLGATEAILSSGLGLVRDSDLRAQIAAWPGMLREIEVDQAVIVERWEKVSDAMVAVGLSSRLTLVAGGQSGEEEPDWDAWRQLIVAMLNEPELHERIGALGRSLEGLLSELRDVEVRLDDLQAAVATELDNHPARRR